MENYKVATNRFKAFVLETRNYPYFGTLYDEDMWEEDYKWVLDRLLAIEIIKRTKIDPVKEVWQYDDYQDYLDYDNDELTREEFDLIKKVLDENETN